MEIDRTARLSEFVSIKGAGRLVIGAFVTIEDNVLLDLGESKASRIVLGARSKIKYGAVLRTYDGSISVGSRTSVGEYSVLAGHGGLMIGDEVIIAGHCYLSAADHIFTSGIPIRFQGETAAGIVVEDGAWLGAGAIVLDGVRVGAGSVIGAGAVVTRNTSPATIYTGNPARKVRSRFR